ncbi:chromo domain-containing protein LHP1 [Vicia villosa]|uniref:chromo domain-containing protein LHP1 n=1 Tax=Vicia villosa TaxID=3911 RepID=UPI00273C0079|nr:chromo domain-containing protein LHP1 [Vicia villosa]
MRKTKKSSSTTSDSDYCQQQPLTTTAAAAEEETTPPPPKLDDGFYEIERIRRKRIRKGELQYLIKWRGWPETANTWEPLQNLQSVPDLIHAFEESLKSSAATGGGKHHHRSKGKRTTTLPPPPQPPQPPTVSTDSALHADNNLAPHFQQTVISTPDNAQSNGDPLQTDRTRGAKRRKPASVKRFKKEECASQTIDANNAAANDVSAAGKPEPAWTQNACNIVKILKPIGYSASLSSYMQDVSVTFMAMRSDGTEVMVDNKYLKTSNPLLLINFYEQHLRYNPSS